MVVVLLCKHDGRRQWKKEEQREEMTFIVVLWIRCNGDDQRLDDEGEGRSMEVSFECLICIKMEMREVINGFAR